VAPPANAAATGSDAAAARSLRFLHAYFVTFLVVGSYLSLKVQARFRSAAAVEGLAIRKHLRNARRIERAIARLQGLFIKVGQLISIMTNFLPEQFRAQLAGLQDAVPARPYGDIERRIREEFDGRGPRELFAVFDETPVASASIGQVHVARTHAGERVAVKVQYPDIDEIVRIDLRTLRRIFGVINWFMPYHGLDGVYREIREMVLEELDFQKEAENIARIAANFTGRQGGPQPEVGGGASPNYGVGFPTVIRDLSTARVLTTEWIDGAKAGDRAQLAVLGIDPRKLARTVVHAYCQQIFTDGLYHADPHPGNLLVEPSGRVVFIDFGAVAKISPAMRRGIVDLIQAGLARDTARVIAAMKEMGFISRHADPAIFDRVVDYLHGQFQEEVKLDSFSLKDLKFDPERGLQRLADLRRMDVSLRDLADHFHVPKEWIMLERTVLLLMGLCTELDRELNPMEVIRPYLEEFVLGKERDWSAFVVDATKEVALSAVALPGDLKKFIARTMQGEIEVRFRGLDEHARLLYALGHQVIYAALAIAAATFWLILDGRGLYVHARWAGYVAWSATGLLALSFLGNRSSGRRRRR
jgi:predicted unusual protein kinase regulating ubiquinone biosynthesis (AarF/ABC1/UbiB family)